MPHALQRNFGFAIPVNPISPRIEAKCPSARLALALGTTDPKEPGTYALALGRTVSCLRHVMYWHPAVWGQSCVKYAEITRSADRYT